MNDARAYELASPHAAHWWADWARRSTHATPMSIRIWQTVPALAPAEVRCD